MHSKNDQAAFCPGALASECPCSTAGLTSPKLYLGQEPERVPLRCYNFNISVKGKNQFMMQAGSPFPNFSLPNQDGKITKLSDYAGHWLVVYFYPKDDTPGCTIQGRAFSAGKSDFDAADIKIVGVSADDVRSHKDFCNKFAFTIDLLADTNSQLMKTLALGQSEWKGMKFWERTTFVLDPKGVIRKVYEKVNPEGHEKVLLNDIMALTAAAA